MPKDKKEVKKKTALQRFVEKANIIDPKKSKRRNDMAAIMEMISKPTEDR